MHIPALDVPAGIAMNTVISDNDDYDGVLPISVVKTVSIYESAKPPAAARGSDAADVVADISRQWRRDSGALASAGAPSPLAAPPGVAAGSAAAPGPARSAAYTGAASAAPLPGQRPAGNSSGQAEPNTALVPQSNGSGGSGFVSASSTTPGSPNPFRGSALYSMAPGAQTEAAKTMSTPTASP